MKVAITHWSAGQPPGGASQRIRGDVIGFLDAGHDVDLYFHNELQELEQNAGNYDLVCTPYIFADQYYDLDAYSDTHLHLTIGGYGNTQKNPRLIKQICETADTVSVLDPGPALYYNEQIELPLDTTHVIPNPPNKGLFKIEPWNEREGYVLTPKIGAWHKKGTMLAEVAAQNGTHVFETHVKHIQFVTQDVNRYPNNVHLKPPVPFSYMPQRYRGAEIVFNAAEKETLPNVCFEAMMSGRPYVSTHDAVALVQSHPELDGGDFGSSVEWFVEEYGEAVYNFDHDPDHLVIRERSELPDAIGELMDDVEKRGDLARAGKRWLDRAYGDYDWTDKAELIADQVD